jgi:serine/threonine protein kinase
VHVSRSLSPSPSGTLLSLDAVDWAGLDPGNIQLATLPSGGLCLLGRRAHGIVVKGLRNGVTPVAVKLVDMAAADVHALGPLVTEVAALKRAQDANVVQLFGARVVPRQFAAGDEESGVGTESQQLMIVLELMPGGTLASRMKSPDFRWAGVRGRAAILDIARGLVHLHSRGLVHLDVKPQNVLLAADGTAKLGDMGVSRFLESAGGYLGTGVAVGGSFNYAAPECILGRRCTTAADVFSLGVLFWELLSGEDVRRGRMRSLVVPDDCPPEIAALVERCLEPEPSMRPTAREVCAVLVAAGGGPPAG